MTLPLRHYIKPLQPYLASAHVSEICINKPGEVWVESDGHFVFYAHPELTLSYLEDLALLVAEASDQEINSEKPLLSALLPGGYRSQFVIAPACAKGQFILSIRKQTISDRSLKDYDQSTWGSIQFTQNKNVRLKQDDELLKLYRQEKPYELVQRAIQKKKNMIISGGTSTGKTTFLNACLKEIPMSERLITIEDVREVHPPQLNTAHLLASRGQQGLAKVSMLNLLEASLRLRPDRIFLSELRGEEAFPFLRAINSGHPGSLSTVHADTPQGCFEQLVFMVMQSGTTLSRQDIITYIKSVIDIIVQIGRDEMGRRYIEDIYYAGCEYDLGV